MSLINLQDINLAFGQQVLFNNLNLTIDTNTNYALVGTNGCGKSTLLKLLVGELTADSGTCSVAKNCLLSYLAQQALHALDELKYVYENKALKAAEAKMRNLETTLAGLPAASTELQDLLAAYHAAQLEFERLGGFTFEAEFKAACAGLNLPASLLEQAPSTLSGGEKMKVALVHCLLSPADLILLDEPTNHLDVNACEWLSAFIRRSKKSFIVVSHDRFFLDQIADKTLMFENQQIVTYNGNYTTAKRLQEEQAALKARELANLMDKLEHEEAVKQTFLSHRNISGYHAREKVVNSLNEKIKTLQAAKVKQSSLRFSFNQPEKLGETDYKRVLMVVKDLAKAYDKTLFSNLDLTLRANAKIALLGENGTGKTTLLKILLGETLADSGEIKFYGDIQIAYMGQVIKFADETETLIEYLSKDNTVPERYIRAQLARYNFPTAVMDKTLESLSGGERHRIYLAKLINLQPDIIFLDEPTNNLDLAAIEELESALAAYKGAIVIVSHDRYFVNKIAETVYAFVNGEFKEFANYEAWRKQLLAENVNDKNKNDSVATLQLKELKATATENNDSKQRRLSQTKLRALKVACSESLEKILACISKLEAVNDEFLQTNSNDAQDYAAYDKRLQDIEALETVYLALAEKYENWQDNAALSVEEGRWLEDKLKEVKQLIAKT